MMISFWPLAISFWLIDIIKLERIFSSPFLFLIQYISKIVSEKSLISFSDFSFVIQIERHKGVIIQSGVS